jgi:predicted small lipoprotein YifL
MLCCARQIFTILVIILGGGQMIAACGQKGPLYLPEDQIRGTAPPKGGEEPVKTPSPAEIPGHEPLPPPIR